MAEDISKGKENKELAGNEGYGQEGYKPETRDNAEKGGEFKERQEMTGSSEIQMERERLSQKSDDKQLSPEEEEEVRKEKLKIEKLDSDGRVKRIFDITKEKGVVFAVKLARALGDPYVEDKLHDILAKDENYKKFER
ncbi:MAG: hypothetical protein A3B96_03195 [Candidatus Spechtbacteria bacterium RIFCSPHIGHO2_02_FULL_43_15b]|uniref:Uncharacterized protein n=1 Tax=Candidatus Spechtbacteria bacterium RIFCSPHIGHO2_01_FULL_43_30 TaxID=1802158 RepID=A0A1G2H8G2_9BACT|nr:MAG: hypothetical protein A2827_00455 [Candidatus Spechtbacteria bacterium RIFCSPHIGHO2_01_FULL_43_30]OGZ59749.1 MAG: hypothetical protein A3B96_03195 [Candidatus Spechtbacteria bacterium RIFCSPHIGHO2_02_FULL_43_15b]